MVSNCGRASSVCKVSEVFQPQIQNEAALALLWHNLKNKRSLQGLGNR